MPENDKKPRSNFAIQRDIDTLIVSIMLYDQRHSSEKPGDFLTRLLNNGTIKRADDFTSEHFNRRLW